MIDETIRARFQLSYEPATYRRVIAGKDVIIHCHHYNSRVQRTVEGASRIDGKGIIREAAETVFAEQVAAALRPDDDAAAKLAVAAGLYAHLGYGTLDLSGVGAGQVTASASHFVEGWLAGFGRPEHTVCTFTEGYLQGALFSATGELFEVRETACMAKGDPACVFALERGRTAPIAENTKRPSGFTPRTSGEFIHSPNIDEQKIIDALVAMPVHGNADGLIPAFSVYLANTPADYYNRVAIRFIEEMTAARREKAAKRMLVSDGETCAMNTFRGIMHSVEWDGLVAPMIRETRDNMFALIAISNALGWGNWHIVAHPGPNALSLESLNGYEAIGFREYRGAAEDPQCYMLAGVAAGLVELVYGEGTLAERLGTCAASESACICCGTSGCRFDVERVQ